MRHIIRFNGQDHAAALAGPSDNRLVLLDEMAFSATLTTGLESSAKLRIGAHETGLHVAGTDEQRWIWHDGDVFELTVLEPLDVYARYAAASTGLETRAPMPGSIVAVPVSEGDLVRAGDTLVIIESMKLEVALKATQPGRVAAIACLPGSTFEKDAVLVTLSALGDG